MDDITRKQLILIDFLKQYVNTNEWKFKAEYSTNDNDTKVVVVQEQTGQKQVLFNGEKIYNYYQIYLEHYFYHPFSFFLVAIILL